MPAPRRETWLGAFGREPAARPDEAPPARTVAEIVQAIRNRLDTDHGLRNIWVRGEVSQFNPHSSGHWYFKLKDDGAALDAVMWRSTVQRAKFQPEEGMEVLARGRIDLYNGRVQLVTDELRPVGAGELAIRFEQLKRKLEAEGLFSAARKRPIPRHPRAIGIVTSLQAAALRDMIRVATARNPGIRIVVANARVQGEGAAGEIASAIFRMNKMTPPVDILIVGRGGGSLEDLWAFNEEPVVRAVAASKIPVVSAVGHETDTTLSDYAADLRAATPSNACEICVPDAAEIRHRLDENEGRMTGALRRLVPDLRQRLDELHTRAHQGTLRTLGRHRDALTANAARLNALSPLAVLSRGYSVVTREGHALRRASEASPGDAVRIRLSEGSLDATITKRNDHDDA